MQHCTFVLSIRFVPLPTDTISSIANDSIAGNDTITNSNFFIETGSQLFNVFINPSQALYKKGILIDHSENIWQFAFLLGMILLLAILKAGFNNRMNQFLSAVLVSRQLRQLMREEGFLYHPFSILLLVNSGVVYSLIIYKSLDYLQWYPHQGSGFLLFNLIMLGTLLLLFLKTMLLRFMEFLTDTDMGQRENRFTWVLFHQVGGLILLPIAAIMIFGKSYLTVPGIIFSASLLIIFLIFRIGKGVLQASGNKVYFLHIFLYLCALEIIPLIVLMKVLVTQINGFNE